MYTRLPDRRAEALTLVETMVATALFSISGLVLATIFMFSLRSMASLCNYAELDRENRMAMDQLTRELRQARQVVSYTTNSSGNSITVVNGEGEDVTYAFDAANQRMTRTVSGDSSTILTNCNLLEFNLFQRNPSNANFGVFPLASGNWTQSVKVVQLTWKTRRTLPNTVINSENIQTARIVIRKQQD